MKKIELLAPAGDLEKLKTAVDYGADAVYFGGEAFSLRAAAGNLTHEEMREGIRYAHAKGVRCYLAINIFLHNEDILPLEQYLLKVRNLGIDAFLVSDPGTVDILKEVMSDAEIHLSTQANMTNYSAAKFWYRQGVKRIVLARELSLQEIREIRDNIPEDMELEAFVHGAMCISYSGRCLLSNVMAARDANRGGCAHPCRWKYHLYSDIGEGPQPQYYISEEQRPGEYYPIEEDDRGTYIMNSRDLCMIGHIADIAAAGINSIKIEGRMKSVFYVATIVSAYRKALDACMQGRPFDQKWADEVAKVSNRGFITGFFYGHPSENDQNYETSDYNREYMFTGVVKSYDPDTAIAVVEQRNKMETGDEIEVFGPGKDFFTQTIDEMTDADGNTIMSAPHAQQEIHIRMKEPAGENYMIRKGRAQHK